MRGVAVAVLMAVAFVFVMPANVLTFQLFDEVNARSPDGDKISPYWTSLKLRRVYERHQALYPESTKRRHADVAMWVGLALGGLAW